MIIDDPERLDRALRRMLDVLVYVAMVDFGAKRHHDSFLGKASATIDRERDYYRAEIALESLTQNPDRRGPSVVMDGQFSDLLDRLETPAHVPTVGELEALHAWARKEADQDVGYGGPDARTLEEQRTERLDRIADAIEDYLSMRRRLHLNLDEHDLA